MGFGSSEGWLSRLKKGLDRTRVNIVGLFSGGVVDEDFLEELEFALITADIGVDTVSSAFTFGSVIRPTSASTPPRVSYNVCATKLN